MSTGTASRLVRRMMRKPARMVRRVVLPRLIRPAAMPLREPADHVRVVGLLSSASGIGKSGRLCAQVLGANGYRVTTDDVAGLFGSDDGIGYRHLGEAPFEPGGISFYHLNPPMLLPGVLKSKLARYRQSYNVAYWAWELENLPREWVDGLKFVDAVAVPSTFCRDAMHRYTSKPVLVIPHPVQEVERRQPAEARGDQPFRVLTIFNFGSSFERKNPLALIEAFRAAFGDDPGAELVLKTSQGARYPQDKARLLKAVAGRPGIRVIDEVWDEDRVNDLIASSDVYASLHRSEGFGLTLAEAIMLEVPVVATNWSGNTDFCGLDSYPVDYDLVPFRDDHGDYSQVVNARWAQPRIDSAVRQLKRIRANPDEARARAARLKRHLVRHLQDHSYAAAIRTLGSAATIDAISRTVRAA